MFGVFRPLLCIAVVFILTDKTKAQERALFIGNSMTFTNNMPDIFQQLALSKGKSVMAQYYAPGGTGFSDHVNDNNVYDLLRTQQWDIVVLQPGTSESAGLSWPVSTTALRGKTLMDSIRKYSPCARIFLYEIPYGIKANNNVPDYNDYFNVQNIIKDSITKMADEMRIPVVPAGECAKHHLSAQQNLLLHNSYNDVHPNLNGSYLVAAAMYCTIYQDMLNPSTYLGGITAFNASYFQRIADTVVLGNKSNWLVGKYDLNADFTMTTTNNLQVTIQNLSVNYDSAAWNFNNEYYTNTSNPSYTFNAPGVKRITLVAFSRQCTDTSIKEIVLGTTSVNEPEHSYFKIVPNPAYEYITIHTHAGGRTDYVLFDLSGKIIRSGNQNQTQKIDIKELPSGCYLIRLTAQDGKKAIRKLIKT